MIAFLDGTVVYKDLNSACIEVGGVGYELGMSKSSLARLPEAGKKARVFTYMQIREDQVNLYGFSSQEEKDVFLRLIGVSGVGAKMALAALSVFEPSQFVSAVMSQDVATVQEIPGVGKKTAQRIILELKGSFDEDFSQLGLGNGGAKGGNPHMQIAREALLSMGFTSTEIDLALEGAPETGEDGALLQYALKRLGN
ncbi:MAG: Holliday junction branch migration protein RuvA [Eggerthellaceae bacterium]|jgi:Holliday junction DNA helicase RuvA